MAQSNFTSKSIGVGVVVADMERSLDFYVNGIGMVKTGNFTINEEFGKRGGLTGGVAAEVNILKLENSPEATDWKLMSFGKKAAHPKPKFIQDDTGAAVHHHPGEIAETDYRKAERTKGRFPGQHADAPEQGRALCVGAGSGRHLCRTDRPD